MFPWLSLCPSPPVGALFSSRVNLTNGSSVPHLHLCPNCLHSSFPSPSPTTKTALCSIVLLNPTGLHQSLSPITAWQHLTLWSLSSPWSTVFPGGPRCSLITLVFLLLYWHSFPVSFAGPPTYFYLWPKHLSNRTVYPSDCLMSQLRDFTGSWMLPSSAWI